jgi:hypothetical protein
LMEPMMQLFVDRHAELLDEPKNIRHDSAAHAPICCCMSCTKTRFDSTGHRRQGRKFARWRDDGIKPRAGRF